MSVPTRAPEAYTRGFRRIVLLLLSLVTIPTVVLLVVGILMLVFYRENIDLVFGIMVVTLVVCLATGSALAMVLLRRQEHLSELQSDFVSKVSHELRTPLTSIRMFVDTLRMGRVPPEGMQAVTEALARETERLSERIERLLIWGRMEAGKRLYDLKPVRPELIVDEALTAFRTATHGRSVEVSVESAPNLPSVAADRAALVEALLNLLTNAYKYSGGDKPIAVTVRADKRWLRIAVRDRGVGIARREHKRIFQKFYRVDERLSQAIEGSGLGLAIVQHIVRAHGGRIEIESTPGNGSIFTVLLPLDDGETPQVE